MRLPPWASPRGGLWPSAPAGSSPTVRPGVRGARVGVLHIERSILRWRSHVDQTLTAQTPGPLSDATRTAGWATWWPVPSRPKTTFRAAVCRTYDLASWVGTRVDMSPTRRNFLLCACAFARPRGECNTIAFMAEVAQAWTGLLSQHVDALLRCPVEVLGAAFVHGEERR